MPANQREPSAHALNILENGDIELKGAIPWSSNYTFVANVKNGDEERLAIYKPAQGERPLHDFSAGLHDRERAAFVVSESLGWNIVPPTVVREDAPAGIGSLQLALTDANQEENYFTFLEQSQYDEELKRIALFDLLINNADRKGGHILRDSGNNLWCIDNGLSFHVEDKLRTVVWDFAGEAVPTEWREKVTEFSKALPDELDTLLDDEEIEVLKSRTDAIADLDKFPEPTSEWSYPWPLI